MDNDQRLLPPPENPDSDPPGSQPVTSGETGRDTKGKFVHGNRANPKGRPMGSRNRASLFARAVLEEKAVELAEKVMADALAGNPIAYKLCLERLVSIPQDSPVTLNLTEPGYANARPRALLSAISIAHNGLACESPLIVHNGLACALVMTFSYSF